MERWVLLNKKADFFEIAKKYHIDPVIARLIRNRDVVGDNEINTYLYGDINDLHEPDTMKDLPEAAELIIKKIREQKRIRIISDYDVDGVAANYILYRGLSACGALVDYKIPNRITDGYGINENLIFEAYGEGIDTIVTCDNGIAAYQQIEYAKNLGMTVIVTDHHDVPFEETAEGKGYILPPADAVVNPKREDCPYPYKKLCGAVVALKFIIYLYEKFRKPKDRWHDFLEIAAIATVCDVMPLTGENRILVKEGLKRLPKTKNFGLQALLSVSGLEDKKVSAYHLGFVIGPCINASGRLSSAEKALNLLLANDREEAVPLAMELKSLNEERKDMTLEGVKNAIELIESSSMKKDKVLTVYLPDCHESLAGIIAGRIREKYHKPVFVLTDSESGFLKGSGRSIEAYSMFEELCKVKDILEKFGGHPMAAGLTLKKDNFSLFHDRLNDVTELTEEDFVAKVTIDVPMPISYITEPLIEQLDLLEPFGTANGKPLFAQKNLSVLGARLIGARRNVCKLQLMDEQGFVMDAVFFGDIEQFNEYLTSHFDPNEVEYMYQGRKNSVRLSFTYYPEINEFRGVKKIQLIIQNYQ